MAVRETMSQRAWTEKERTLLIISFLPNQPSSTPRVIKLRLRGYARPGSGRACRSRVSAVIMCGGKRGHCKQACNGYESKEDESNDAQSRETPAVSRTEKFR